MALRLRAQPSPISAKIGYLAAGSRLATIRPTPGTPAAGVFGGGRPRLRLLHRLAATDHSNEAVAALPVENAVLDGEAVLMRPEHHQFFEAALTFHTDRLTS